jgi:TRAP-type C4-dicarboxylate transport system substrate-binding protein
MLEQTWRTLGAIPTPLPFPEVFNGLQQGVIDGDALPVASIHLFKFYEPARHVSMAKVAVGMAPMLISDKYLNKMPKAYQELIIKAGRESAMANRTAEADTTQKALTFLKANDVTIVEPDLDEFRAALGPVMDTARQTFGASLVDAIAAGQTGC